MTQATISATGTAPLGFGGGNVATGSGARRAVSVPEPTHPSTLVGTTFEDADRWQDQFKMIEASFDKNFWPVVKAVTAHVIARWKHCRAMVMDGKYLEVVQPVSLEHEGHTLKIPKSSLIEQHQRAVELGSKFLVAAFGILSVEMCESRPMKEYWGRLTEAHIGVQESNFINPGRRDVYEQSAQDLDNLTEEIRLRLYGPGGSRIKPAGGVQHALMLTRFDDELHVIINGLRQGVVSWYDELREAIDIISFTDLSIPTLVEDITAQIAAEVGRPVSGLDSSVRTVRDTLRRGTLRNIVFAVELTEASSGPCSITNFSVTALPDIFERCITLCGRSPEEFTLHEEVEGQAAANILGLSVTQRTLLGLAVNNLVLNSVQALNTQIQDGPLVTTVRCNCLNDDQLCFQIVTHGVTIGDDTLDRARNVIDNPHMAKIVASLNQGGNGLANAGICLTDKDLLAGPRPIINRCDEGVMVTFAVEISSLMRQKELQNLS